MDPRTKKAVAIVVAAMSFVWVGAWAASNLYNSLYGPAEYYGQQSIFFRSTTNPAQVIPVMASTGYKLPVDAAVTMDTSQTLKVQSDQNTGALNADGGPTTVNATTPVTITFPSGTQGILVNAFGGDVIMNHVSRLKTGTFYVGYKITSGTAGVWTGLSTSTPTLGFCANNGSVASITYMFW